MFNQISCREAEDKTDSLPDSVRVNFEEYLSENFPNVRAKYNGRLVDDYPFFFYHFLRKVELPADAEK